LLDDVRSGMTPLDLARAWTDRVPLRSALQIAAWMLEHGLLVRAGCCEGLRADAHRFDH
jgi:hypothetical protein